MTSKEQLSEDLGTMLNRHITQVRSVLDFSKDMRKDAKEYLEDLSKERGNSVTEKLYKMAFIKVGASMVIEDIWDNDCKDGLKKAIKYFGYTDRIRKKRLEAIDTVHKSISKNIKENQEVNKQLSKYTKKYVVAEKWDKGNMFIFFYPFGVTYNRTVNKTLNSKLMAKSENMVFIQFKQRMLERSKKSHKQTKESLSMFV